MAELAAFLPALISGGGALAGMLGGGPPTPAPVWHPPGMNQAANNVTSTIGQNMSNNVPAQLMPQYQGQVGSLLNNPGAAGAMGGANAASGLGFNAAGAAAGGGDYLSMLAHMLGTQAFDPQNALYGRTAQQVQQQSRAGLEARGMDMTPYGAGVEGNTMSNFNIDWQNNLLQRMMGGGGAAGNLMNSGVNLSSMAPGMALNAGLYPYTTFNQIGQTNLGNLDRLAGAGLNAQTIPNNSINQWLQYIGQGNNANSVSNQNAQVGGANQQLGFMQNQILGGQLGQSVNAFNRAGGMNGFSSGINNMFSGGGGAGRGVFGGGSGGYSADTSGIGWG